MSQLKFFRMSFFAAAVLAGFFGAAGTVRADSNSPLSQKMDTMAVALFDLNNPTDPSVKTAPLDDLKALKDAAIDCRDHAADLAPEVVAKDAQALQGFKAEFVLLVDKVAVLETAMLLPADAPTRAAQIKAALADITALKKDGHSKYKQ